jgi:hypothetical protein
MGFIPDPDPDNRSLIDALERGANELVGPRGPVERFHIGAILVALSRYHRDNGNMVETEGGGP